MDLSGVKGTIATDIAVSTPSFLLHTTATSMQDEEKIYQELSIKLREIEHSLEFSLSTVTRIEQEAKQIFMQQDKREELLLRCKCIMQDKIPSKCKLKFQHPSVI